MTLAPDLSGSLEKVIAESNSRFNVKLDSNLAFQVFPTVEVSELDIQNADSIKLQVSGESAKALNWSYQDGLDALDIALAELELPPEVKVKAKQVGSNYQFLLKTKHEAMALTLIPTTGGVATNFPSQKTRGELMRELVTGVLAGETLPIAVLSGRFSFDPVRLSPHHLDVRCGDNFTRRVYFNKLGRESSIYDLPSIISKSLNEDGNLSALHDISIEDKEGLCVIRIPAGTQLENTNDPKLFIGIDDKPLESPRIVNVNVDTSMTIQYKDDVEWLPENGHKVTLHTGQPLDSLLGEINSLITGESLAELIDRYTLKITAPADKSLRISDSDTDTLARTLGLIEPQETEVVISSGINISSNRVATPKDLENLGSATFTLTEDGAPGKQVSIDVDLRKINSAQGIKTQLEQEFRNTTDTPAPAFSIHAEIIKDQILIWDHNYDVQVLDQVDDRSSGAAQLGLTSETGMTSEALNSLQLDLPIVAKLSEGNSGKQGETDDYRLALKQLERRPEVSIICLPGHAWDKGSGRSYEVVEEAIMHAERQQDRMVIIDPPRPNGDESKWQDKKSIEDAQLPTSSYAAIYYPWILVNVPTGTTDTSVPPTKTMVAPSGFVAGVWSWMDRERGVWKAPAGVDARVYGVDSFLHELTDAEGGVLNLEGVNALRNLPGFGSVVWGSRTAATKAEPQWKYLPVRRTAIMIEDSLRGSLAWAVHQPNRPALWASLRLNIEAFLERLFQAGAFQPDNPRDAYFVQCGLNSTMSQADIDAGVVRVRIGIAPSKPAEFVIIEIEQINEQG